MPEMQEADSKGAELKHNHKEEILLDALLKYVIPFFNKTKTDNKKSQGRLEELVKKEKTSLKPLELIFLEDMINLFLNKLSPIGICPTGKLKYNWFDFSDSIAPVV